MIVYDRCKDLWQEGWLRAKIFRISSWIRSKAYAPSCLCVETLQTSCLIISLNKIIVLGPPTTNLICDTEVEPSGWATIYVAGGFCSFVFKVACTRLFKSPCRSVGLPIGPLPAILALGRQNRCGKRLMSCIRPCSSRCFSHGMFKGRIAYYWKLTTTTAAFLC